MNNRIGSHMDRYRDARIGIGMLRKVHTIRTLREKVYMAKLAVFISVPKKRKTH